MLISELIRLIIFVSFVVVVYWVTFRWCFEFFLSKKEPTGVFAQYFRSKITGVVLCSIAGAGLLCMGYGFFIEPQRLTVTTYRIETSKIPAGEYVRIVHLADLHVRRNGSREQRLAALVTSLQPDFICHTGDFFGRKGVYRDVIEVLESWKVPQYACVGNLDYFGDFDAVMQYAEVIALDGMYAKVNVRGARLYLAGLPSGAEGAMPKVLASMPRDTFNIVLYHHPQGYPMSWNTPADLMLAGHIHGGQIRMPWYGALVTLDACGKRYEYGFYDEGGVKLIVSRGIGCETYLPEVRFLCPPEVVLIEVVGTGTPSANDAADRKRGHRIEKLDFGGL